MINLRAYCGRCGTKVLSAMDLQKDPWQEEATITVPKSAQISDPRDANNVIRTIVQEKHVQKPALICSGCYSDQVDVPTASAIWVGGGKE